MDKVTCGICGAWSGLHRYGTENCPVDGVEARPDRKQEWADTVFTPEPSWASLKEENEKLKQRIEALIHNHALTKAKIELIAAQAENKRLREVVEIAKQFIIDEREFRPTDRIKQKADIFLAVYKALNYIEDEKTN